MPATPQQNESIREFIQERAKASIGPWVDMVFDPPEYLRRDLSGADPLTQTDQAIGRSICRAWSRSNKDSFDPDNVSLLGGRCKPYLEDIGEWPGDGFAGPLVPGGQCQGIGYQVSGTQTVFTGNPPAPQTVNVGPFPVGFGPIVTTRVTQIFFGQFQESRVFTGSSNPDGSGAPVVVSLFVTDTGPSGNPLVRDGQYSLSRNDGGPDNCGNQPGDYRPPPALDPADPFSPKLPNPWGGPDINIDIGFDPDGNINIDLPDFPGDPLDPIDPNDPDPPGGEDQPNPGDQGQPGGAGETGPGGEEDGEDDNRILVGVLVDLISSPANANVQFTPAGPQYRAALWVYMGGDAGLELDTDGAFLNPPQFFTAPENANKYRVVANPGYNLSVTPYWKDAE